MRARLRPVDLLQPRLHRPRRPARGQGHRAAHQGHAGPRPRRRAPGYGAGHGYYLTYARHRVEAGGALVGLTHQTATIDTAGTILSLTLIDKEYAAPGTEVTVELGRAPGHGTDPDADLGFPRIRATVAPAPYDAHARTSYRAAG